MHGLNTTGGGGLSDIANDDWIMSFILNVRDPGSTTFVHY